MAAELRAVPGRLDAVVARLLGVPRAEVQRAIETGGVLVDGLRRPKAHRLAGGERLTVDLTGVRALEPEGPAVPVRWRDEHLAVVAKPASLPSHPTEARRSGTLVNRLLGMGLPLAPGADPLRPGIVHRLDAGTSGLLLVALDEETRDRLSAMFRRHDVERRYLALVRGIPDYERFVVDAPLGRRGARIRLDAATGRAAETAFRVLERFARATLLEAAPRTGRTHQIRVHLSSVGHPIVGDARYGGGGDEARGLGLTRPFLHSWRIAFEHPATGQRIEVEEPLPEDLTEALRRVRGEA
ncbi:MAG TPA: RluA family pseudouridine synthase [Actinomycetota bacterium]|nr:RluA family pseudouridine synthase [Actinomycetota bacterium]